jgi:hypothetical protein
MSFMIDVKKDGLPLAACLVSTAVLIVLIVLSSRIQSELRDVKKILLSAPTNSEMTVQSPNNQSVFDWKQRLLIKNYSDSAKVGCNESWNQDAPDSWIRFTYGEISIELPFNLSWGSDRFAPQAYDINKDSVSFGPVSQKGDPCELFRGGLMRFHGSMTDAELQATLDTRSKQGLMDTKVFKSNYGPEKTVHHYLGSRGTGNTYFVVYKGITYEFAFPGPSAWQSGDVALRIINSLQQNVNWLDKNY